MEDLAKLQKTKLGKEQEIMKLKQEKKQSKEKKKLLKEKEKNLVALSLKLSSLQRHIEVQR